MPVFPAANETPSSDPQVVRGRYLVTAAACGDCHSPTAKPTDPFGPANPKWMSGSDRPFTVGEWTTYAPNLTPDRTTGLGDWSARQIRRALQTGQDDEGRMLCPPMPSAAVYHNLTAADALAIAAYLQSIKPVSNAVPEPKGPPCPKTVPTLPPYPAAQEVNVP
jgi:mono/diheme cytochrome c family protein